MKTCELCGATFLPTSNSIRNKHYQGRYCSRRCANKARAVPLEDRILLQGSDLDMETGCLLWLGTLDHDGYGVIQEGRRQYRVHRLVWERANGPIPQGVRVLHRCDVRRCYHLGHLFLGTDTENMADRHAKERDARGEGHGRARLTEADVRAIRALYAEGAASQQALANRYGVSQNSVSALIRRKTWRHVG